jgi:hypothetical protein
MELILGNQQLWGYKFEEKLYIWWYVNKKVYDPLI